LLSASKLRLMSSRRANDALRTANRGGLAGSVCHVVSSAIDERYANATQNLALVGEDAEGSVESFESASGAVGGRLRLHGGASLEGTVVGPEKPLAEVIKEATGQVAMDRFLAGEEHACVLSYGGSGSASDTVLYGTAEAGQSVSVRDRRRWGLLHKLGADALDGVRAIFPDSTGHAQLYLTVVAFRLGKQVDLLGALRPTSQRIGLDAAKDYTLVEGVVSGNKSPRVMGASEHEISSLELLFKAVTDARKGLAMDSARSGGRGLPYQGHVVWLFTLRSFDFASDTVRESRLSVVRLAPGLVLPTQLGQLWGVDPWDAAERYENAYARGGGARMRPVHASMGEGMSSYELRELTRRARATVERMAASGEGGTPSVPPGASAIDTEALGFFAGLTRGLARISGLILVSQAPGSELENRMAAEIARAVACIQAIPVRSTVAAGQIGVTRERVSSLWHAANREWRRRMKANIAKGEVAVEDKYKTTVAASRAMSFKQQLEALEYLICSRNLASNAPVLLQRPASSSPRSPSPTPRSPPSPSSPSSLRPSSAIPPSSPLTPSSPSPLSPSSLRPSSAFVPSSARSLSRSSSIKVRPPSILVPPPTAP